MSNRRQLARERLEYYLVYLLLKIVTISWTEYKRPKRMITLGGYTFVLHLITGLTFAIASLATQFEKAG